MAANRMEQLWIVAKCQGDRSKVAWINLLKDKSISVGLADRSIRVDALLTESQKVVQLDRPLDNPHMTFHPPAWVHLRSRGRKPIYQGLTWTDHSPWIRFISNPLRNLNASAAGRGGSVKIMPLRVDTLDVSAQVCIDFVTQLPPASLHPTVWRVIPWGDVSIGIAVRRLPPQSANLEFVELRHEHTTTIHGRRPDAPRQHARQRRAVARRVVRAVPPSGDPERRSVVR
jgi:hypothetical protein